ncbi:MAG: hypothetical protein Q8P20_07500 [bacterium]|nr:hypothetical protein [bacterium]
MHYDVKAIQNELEEVDRLIDLGLLQPMRMGRAIQVANQGLTGLACADGWYNKATADYCERIHFVQHLLKLNGTGFLLGLDPANFEGRIREYPVIL